MRARHGGGVSRRRHRRQRALAEDDRGHRRAAADSRRAAGDGRKPEVLADSAYIILNRDSRTFSGNFCIDEDVLASEGITDLDQYAFVPGAKQLLTDLFLTSDTRRSTGDRDAQESRQSVNSKSSSLLTILRLICH